MQDAADNAAIIHPCFPADIRRQNRRDLLPLLVVQPKQIASHDLRSIAAENHYSAYSSRKLLGFDPSR
jgi:hypothetical protein